MRTLFYTFFLCLTVSLSALAQKDMKGPIMAANQKFMDAFSTGAATMGGLYTTDATLLPPGSEPIQGSTAIGTFWKGAYESGVKKAKLETIEATMGGDQIIEVGQYTLYGANDAPLDKGKYMVAWKQEKGEWKLHRDIWNTTMAAK